MPLNYTPEARAVKLAERVLAMKISVDGVLGAINDEKEKYRRRMTSLVENAEATITHAVDDETIPERAVDRAYEHRDMFGDVEGRLEIMFGSREKGLESMRGIIDNQLLSTLQVEELLADLETTAIRKIAIVKMIDVALWQMLEVLGHDPYVDADLVTQAGHIIYDRLNIPT